MNLILFGPPGAGKGTQAENLSKNYNLHKVSTGDLLRSEIDKNTALGNQIKEIVNKGDFVSDLLINKLIDNLLSKKNFVNRLIFDGYPRTLNQAKMLDVLLKKFNQKILCVLSLEVEKETIIKRILGRAVCTKCGSIFNEYFNPPTKKNHKCESRFLQKRSDDNKATIEARFNNYSQQTLPVLNYYKSMDLLYEVNGMNEIMTIYKEISLIIEGLKG